MVRTIRGPALPPVFHPQSDHRAVLARLYSHPFVDDPFRCLWYLDPALLPGPKPSMVVAQITIQLEYVPFPPVLFIVTGQLSA